MPGVICGTWKGNVQASIARPKPLNPKKVSTRAALLERNRAPDQLDPTGPSATVWQYSGYWILHSKTGACGFSADISGNDFAELRVAVYELIVVVGHLSPGCSKCAAAEADTRLFGNLRRRNGTLFCVFSTTG